MRIGSVPIAVVATGGKSIPKMAQRFGDRGTRLVPSSNAAGACPSHSTSGCWAAEALPGIAVPCAFTCVDAAFDESMCSRIGLSAPATSNFPRMREGQDIAIALLLSAFVGVFDLLRKPREK